MGRPVRDGYTRPAPAWYDGSMSEQFRRVGKALMGSQAGGFLSTPPGLDGDPGLGIPGISGVPRAREWDAVDSTHAPALRGDEVNFVALADGERTLIVDEDEPDGSVAPLADAVEETLEPPYRAVGRRQSDDVWAVGAVRVDVVELSEDVAGDSIELTSVDGTRELTVDGSASTVELPALEEIGAQRGNDYVLRAERLTATTWVVDTDVL
jgi:hypothetical protein